MITFEEAKELKFGEVLLDQRGKRWRVNGRVRLWKRSPDRIYVPLKHGLYSYDYLTESEFIEGKCEFLSKEE